MVAQIPSDLKKAWKMLDMKSMESEVSKYSRIFIGKKDEKGYKLGVHTDTYHCTDAVTHQGHCTTNSNCNPTHNSSCPTQDYSCKGMELYRGNKKVSLKL